MLDMQYGCVDWFGSKGLPYGYIKRDSDSLRTYVHYKGISEVGQPNPKYRTLIAGQKVSYRIAQGYHNPGTQAIEVIVLVEEVVDGSSYRGTGGDRSGSLAGSPE